MPLLCLFLGFAVLSGSPDGTIAAGAESGPPTDGAAVTAAAKSIDEHVERLRVEARGKLLAKEADRLRAVEQAGPPGREIIGKLKAAEPAIREAVAPLLADSARPVEQDLQGLVRVLDRQIQEMTTAWRDVRVADRESRVGSGEQQPRQGHGRRHAVALER